MQFRPRNALRISRETGDAGNDTGDDQRPQWSVLQVAVQKRDRDALDDAELRLLDGVRQEMRRTRQREEELRANCETVEAARETRRVQAVGGTLRGEQRRASAWKGQGGTGDPGSGQDH